MYDFVERFYPEVEYVDLVQLSRGLLGSSIEKDYDSLVEKAKYIYPKVRFIYVNYERYKFALKFIKQENFVIDVPCGSGYGTALLASRGCEVLGIDIDKLTIEKARAQYKYHNVYFLAGDMMEIPLPQADVITCFEGLEHITPGERLIERFCGALNDRGKLIVSIPINEHIVRPDKSNPYHKEDYDLEKLSKLLETYFGDVLYFGCDHMGSISNVNNAFDSIVAVCEV